MVPPKGMTDQRLSQPAWMLRLLCLEQNNWKLHSMTSIEFDSFVLMILQQENENAIGTVRIISIVSPTHHEYVLPWVLHELEHAAEKADIIDLAEVA